MSKRQPRLNDVIDVPADILESAGVYNRYARVDSGLYIDPHLLAGSSAQELRGAANTFNEHWVKVFRLLKQATEESSPFFRRATRMLTFREISHLGLGYAKGNTQGSAIGIGLATAICETAWLLCRAGSTDPEIFDLMGVLQENVGPDRISDMAASIAHKHIIEYTSRVAR